MAEDLGYGGAFTPQIVSAEVLEIMRNIMGPAPEQGSKWMMLDLETGKYNWYQAKKRGRSYARQSYGRRRRY